MKTSLRALCLLLAWPLCASADYTLNITQQKHTQPGQYSSRGTVMGQAWKAAIAVRNGNFQPSPELTLRYIVFVHRGEDGKTEQIRESKVIPSLNPGETITLDTKQVDLTLPGSYDRLLGYWVRLYSGDTLLTEQKNPTGMWQEWNFPEPKKKGKGKKNKGE